MFFIILSKIRLKTKEKRKRKKKDNGSGFDVTMGSLDGAETCELVVCYMLSLLQQRYGNSFGLYRDDGLGTSALSPKQAEKVKQEVCGIFQENDLRITTEVNKKVVDYLDATMDLSTRLYRPYMKPNNTLQYINVKSNHPPAILKNIPEGINKRLSEISSNKEVFDQAAPPYQKALNESGYAFSLHYLKPQSRRVEKRKRTRNIIWFNPPYDRNVKTSIGKEFFKILAKCFPLGNTLHKILNRNTIKLSYSCMPSMKVKIDGNNMNVLNSNSEDEKLCNCPKNATCPLNGECLRNDIVYQATVTCGETSESYVGITATSFKARLANHKA